MFRDSSADATRIPGQGAVGASLRRLTTSSFCRSKPSGRQCSLAPDPGGTPRPRLGTPLRMHSSIVTKTPVDLGFKWWQVLGSNQRRLSRRFYRQPSMRIPGAPSPAITPPGARLPTITFRAGSVRGKLPFTCPLNCSDGRDLSAGRQSATEPARNHDTAAPEDHADVISPVASGWIRLTAHVHTRIEGPVTQCANHITVRQTQSHYRRLGAAWRNPSASGHRMRA